MRGVVDYVVRLQITRVYVHEYLSYVYATVGSKPTK